MTFVVVACSANFLCVTCDGRNFGGSREPLGTSLGNLSRPHTNEIHSIDLGVAAALTVRKTEVQSIGIIAGDRRQRPEVKRSRQKVSRRHRANSVLVAAHELFLCW